LVSAPTSSPRRPVLRAQEMRNPKTPAVHSSIYMLDTPYACRPHVLFSVENGGHPFAPLAPFSSTSGDAMALHTVDPPGPRFWYLFSTLGPPVKNSTIISRIYDFLNVFASCSCDSLGLSRWLARCRMPRVIAHRSQTVHTYALKLHSPALLTRDRHHQQAESFADAKLWEMLGNARVQPREARGLATFLWALPSNAFCPTRLLWLCACAQLAPSCFLHAPCCMQGLLEGVQYERLGQSPTATHIIIIIARHLDTHGLSPALTTHTGAVVSPSSSSSSSPSSCLAGERRRPRRRRHQLWRSPRCLAST
jgi:hypothetical protein